MASRRWQKVKKIIINDYPRKEDDVIQKIPINCALKIIRHAASYVEILQFRKHDKNGYEYFIYGNHYYQVIKPVRADTILELLISAGATKVSVLIFYQKLPKAELMRKFLRNNKVKTLKYIESKDHHRHIPTEGIKHLSLQLSSNLAWDSDSHSFKGVRSLFSYCRIKGNS